MTDRRRAAALVAIIVLIAGLSLGAVLVRMVVATALPPVAVLAASGPGGALLQ